MVTELPLLRDLPRASVPAGTVLFAPDRPCNGFPVVWQGRVRVSLGFDNGRRIDLYSVQPGEACILTTAALLGRRSLARHAVEAVAATPSEVSIIPAEAFGRAITEQAVFRDYVFANFADRLLDLTTLIEAVVVRRLDQRLAAALLRRGPVIHDTHQAFADELGTVREMISRLLDRFAQRGWISLSRRQIAIEDEAALREMAAA